MRREEILNQLKKAEKPISASKFAQRFGVSRQIIVGDIALMRAAGIGIVATARGYRLEKEEIDGKVSKIAVQHDASQIREEFETILAYGGEVIDVIVEHELYGELVGGLYIKNEKDIDDFLSRYQKAGASLLSDLTKGIHLHTIRYQKEEDLERIKQALAEKGILYQEN